MIPEDLRSNPLLASLAGFNDSAVESTLLDGGQPVLVIEPSSIVSVCRALKENHGYGRLSGITALDWLPMEPRFEVVYFLHSMERRADRLRLKCRLSGDVPEIDSIVTIWKGANWYEREIFDLFGISFRNHPDLRRIMMPDGWDGHPLRKDFPVYGNKYTYKDE